AGSLTPTLFRSTGRGSGDAVGRLIWYLSPRRCRTGQRPNQYDRIVIPGRVWGGEGEVRYACLGRTEGKGTFHFNAETMKAMYRGTWRPPEPLRFAGLRV